MRIILTLMPLATAHERGGESVFVQWVVSGVAIAGSHGSEGVLGAAGSMDHRRSSQASGSFSPGRRSGFLSSGEF